MDQPILSSKVFIKPPSRVERRVNPQSEIAKLLGARTSELQRRFGAVARRSSISLKQERAEWPVPRFSPDEAVTMPGSASYAYLDHSCYDADIGLCVVRRLTEVDGAVGGLMVRTNRLAHLCVLSCEELPDYVQEADVYRGLQALPHRVVQRGEILVGTDTEEPGNKKNPMQMGTMSIREIDELDDEKIRDLLVWVHLQKRQNLRNSTLPT